METVLKLLFKIVHIEQKLYVTGTKSLQNWTQNYNWILELRGDNLLPDIINYIYNLQEKVICIVNANSDVKRLMKDYPYYDIIRMSLSQKC